MDYQHFIIKLNTKLDEYKKWYLEYSIHTNIIINHSVLVLAVSFSAYLLVFILLISSNLLCRCFSADIPLEWCLSISFNISAESFRSIYLYFCSLSNDFCSPSTLFSQSSFFSSLPGSLFYNWVFILLRLSL